MMVDQQKHFCHKCIFLVLALRIDKNYTLIDMANFRYLVAFKMVQNIFRKTFFQTSSLYKMKLDM